MKFEYRNGYKYRLNCQRNAKKTPNGMLAMVISLGFDVVKECKIHRIFVMYRKGRLCCWECKTPWNI